VIGRLFALFARPCAAFVPFYEIVRAVRPRVAVR
jgi:hypothetical protein